MSERGFQTRAIHGASLPPVDQQTPSVPLYQTSTFRFDDADAYADTIAFQAPGYTYTRGYGNPTLDAFEGLIASLERTEAAMSFSSGMAAIHTLWTAHVGCGERIVATNALYGGAFALATTVLPRFGVTVGGHKLSEPLRLTAGVEIRLGNVTLHVESATAPGLGAGGATEPGADGGAGPNATIVVPVNATSLGLRAPAPMAGDGALRPRLRSGWALKRLNESGDDERWVLRDLRNDSFRTIEPEDAALLQMLDGRLTVAELLTRATATVGENAQSSPVTRTSRAVISPMRRIKAGSRAAPSPILCGKMVAPGMLLCPWTASVPHNTGTRGSSGVPQDAS